MGGKLLTLTVFALFLAIARPAFAGEGCDTIQCFRCGALYGSLRHLFWPGRGDLASDAKPERLALVPSTDPVLKQMAKEIPMEEIPSPEMQKFFDDLVFTMNRSGGIGLAAPQIGRSLRVAVIFGPEGPLVVVNPRMTVLDATPVSFPEGCLSLPGVTRWVRRNKEVRLEFTDRFGRPRVLDLGKFPAVVAQHELDHLDGILITDPRQ